MINDIEEVQYSYCCAHNHETVLAVGTTRHQVCGKNREAIPSDAAGCGMAIRHHVA